MVEIYLDAAIEFWLPYLGADLMRALEPAHSPTPAGAPFGERLTLEFQVDDQALTLETYDGMTARLQYGAGMVLARYHLTRSNVLRLLGGDWAARFE